MLATSSLCIGLVNTILQNYFHVNAIGQGGGVRDQRTVRRFSMTPISPDIILAVGTDS